jgi:hypothetical protein
VLLMMHCLAHLSDCLLVWPHTSSSSFVQSQHTAATSKLQPWLKRRAPHSLLRYVQANAVHAGGRTPPFQHQQQQQLRRAAAAGDVQPAFGCGGAGCDCQVTPSHATIFLLLHHC